MKLFKTFMLLAVASAFVACSEKEEWNKNEASVSLANETMKISEAKGLFNIPIAVDGERDGNVKVIVEVKEADENGAIEDENYIITTKTIVISPDQEQGKIEIIAVDDDEINENRAFCVTIIKAEGATINDSKKSTVVTLKDNDSAFYEKLAGKWTMTFQSEYEDEPVSWDLNVVADDEEGENYNKYLYVTGMMGYPWTEAYLEFNYDKETKTGTVSFVPSLFAANVNFGSIGVQNTYLYGMSVEGKPVEAPLVGTWSDDFKTITFTPDPEGAVGLFFYIEAGYVWDCGTVVSMTKK